MLPSIHLYLYIRIIGCGTKVEDGGDVEQGDGGAALVGGEAAVGEGDEDEPRGRRGAEEEQEEGAGP